MKDQNVKSLDHKTFLTNLRQAIADRGITPYALAVKLGIDKSAVSGLFRGTPDPRLSTVLRIVKSMQISMDYLVKDIYTPFQQDNAPAPDIKNKTNSLEKTASEMHNCDIELLEEIAVLLSERRERKVTKLIEAVEKYKSKKAEFEVSNDDSNDD